MWAVQTGSERHASAHCTPCKAFPVLFLHKPSHTALGLFSLLGQTPDIFLCVSLTTLQTGVQSWRKWGLAYESVLNWKILQFCYGMIHQSCNTPHEFKKTHTHIHTHSMPNTHTHTRTPRGGGGHSPWFMVPTAKWTSGAVAVIRSRLEKGGGAVMTQELSEGGGGGCIRGPSLWGCSCWLV